jgi:hypothetical protein
MEKIRPDKKNSTYYHKIVFKTNKKPIVGWSKAIGYEEPKDKVICLQNILVRLRTGAYTPFGGRNSRGEQVDPTESIIFYHNHSHEFICQISDDNLDADLQSMQPRFWRWIQVFLKECQQGKDESFLMKKHLYFNYEKLFDIDTPRFLSKDMCRTWCDQKIAEGHSPDDIETFYTNTCQRWFQDNDKLDLGKIQGQNTMRRKAKNQMGELINKSTTR